MHQIAIIPARGGSKRIPGKNIRNFHGKPIISYSILAAIESGIFERVIVSTDSEEIAEVSRNFGAEVQGMRPPEISDDFATTNAVMKFEVSLIQAKMNAEYYCCIYPTVPMISVESLKIGLKTITNYDWEYVFAAFRNQRPVQRYFSLTPNQTVNLLLEKYATSRTQDLPATFRDAGQFYWGNKNAWLKEQPLLLSKSTIVEVSDAFALDIDTEDDWLRAEALYLLKDLPPLK